MTAPFPQATGLDSAHLHSAVLWDTPQLPRHLIDTVSSDLHIFSFERDRQKVASLEHGTELANGLQISSNKPNQSQTQA